MKSRPRRFPSRYRPSAIVRAPGCGGSTAVARHQRRRVRPRCGGSGLVAAHRRDGRRAAEQVHRRHRPRAHRLSRAKPRRSTRALHHCHSRRQRPRSGAGAGRPTLRTAARQARLAARPPVEATTPTATRANQGHPGLRALRPAHRSPARPSRPPRHRRLPAQRRAHRPGQGPRRPLPLPRLQHRSPVLRPRPRATLAPRPHRRTKPAHPLPTPPPHQTTTRLAPPPRRRRHRHLDRPHRPGPHHRTPGRPPHPRPAARARRALPRHALRSDQHHDSPHDHVELERARDHPRAAARTHPGSRSRLVRWLRTPALHLHRRPASRHRPDDELTRPIPTSRPSDRRRHASDRSPDIERPAARWCHVGSTSAPWNLDGSTGRRR